MIRLPAIRSDFASLEADAVAYARQWLAERRDVDPFGTGVPALHPSAGHALVRQQLKALCGRPDGMLWVVANARAGWKDADAALRDLAREYLHVHKLPPVPLTNYMMERDAGTIALPPPGRQEGDNYLRDVMIVFLVNEVCQKFGLRPYRSRTSRSPVRRPSGCSVAAQAIAHEFPNGVFKPPERAIEKIHERLQHVL